ncbi:hypothetical protein LZ32DRAFT_598028 [Colletotrichum eremochloae]|nr:hypothetical protein LZ32DRAFT_598028 [Colletotrichum eremochloae]
MEGSNIRKLAGRWWRPARRGVLAPLVSERIHEAIRSRITGYKWFEREEVKKTKGYMLYVEWWILMLCRTRRGRGRYVRFLGPEGFIHIAYALRQVRDVGGVGSAGLVWSHRHQKAGLEGKAGQEQHESKALLIPKCPPSFLARSSTASLPLLLSPLFLAPCS